MTTRASIEQVAGILVREGLRFQTHEDGDSYRLLFGEDAVFIHFESVGDHVRIALSSPALQDIDEDGAGAAIALNELNRLNVEHRFVKWVFDEGTLIAGVDLLGDDLQASELRNAVYTLAGTVSQVAEELEERVGGSRYGELLEEELDELEVEDE